MKLSIHNLANLHVLWVSLAFLVGLLLGAQLLLPVWGWLGLAALGLAGGLLLRLFNKNSALLIAAIPFFLFLGAARYQFAQPNLTPNDLAYYNDLPKTVWVTGSLTEPPDVHDTYQNLRVKVHAVDFGDGDIPIEGMLLVRVRYADYMEYGQLIRARGEIQTPAEGETFSYRDYLEIHGIHSTMSVTRVTRLPQDGEKNPIWELIYRVKVSLSYRIYLLFPDPEASLLHGILLGDDDGMSASVQQAFKNTGTSHIIAISGFNIAIIAGLFVSIFSRLFGQRIGAAVAIMGIGGYTLLVGADASVVRAAIMGTISIIALLMGRRTAALNILALVAALMAFDNPLILRDVGFQLSFAATLGLVLYAQELEEWSAAKLRKFLPASQVERIIVPISSYFLMTLAAQVTTLPVIAYHFERISLAAFIVNPLILPAQPPVMILGGLAAITSHIYMPLAKVIAAIAWPFPAYTIRVVEFFDQMPNASIGIGEFSLLLLVGFYALLFALTFGGPQFRQRAAKALSPATLLVVLSVIAFLAWRLALSAPDGRLHLTFMDVGSGNAILIQTPAGRNILVNGGPSHSRLSDQLGRRLPPFNRELDFLVIASTQENQLKALPSVLDRFPPRTVLWSGDITASNAARQVNLWLSGNGIDTQRAELGSRLDLGEGAFLQVLDVSERGMVLLVEWKTFRALLPIGVKFETYERLKNGREIGPVSALLLAESGYAPANPPEWLVNLSPAMFILPVAGDDLDGLPSLALVDLLRDQTVLRTDRNGWIRLSTDGDQLWVEVERK